MHKDIACSIVYDQTCFRYLQPPKTSLSLAMAQVPAKEREKVTFPCQMQRECVFLLMYLGPEDYPPLLSPSTRVRQPRLQANTTGNSTLRERKQEHGGNIIITGRPQDLAFGSQNFGTYLFVLFYGLDYLFRKVISTRCGHHYHEQISHTTCNGCNP